MIKYIFAVFSSTILVSCSECTKKEEDLAYRHTAHHLLKLLKENKVDSTKLLMLRNYSEKLSSINEVKLLQELLSNVNEIPDSNTYEFDSTSLLYNNTRSYHIKLYRDNLVDPDKFIGTIQLSFKNGQPGDVYDLNSIKRVSVLK